MLPLDCWCYICSFFYGINDFFNILLTIRGFRDHIQFVNSTNACRNIVFKTNWDSHQLSKMFSIVQKSDIYRIKPRKRFEMKVKVEEEEKKFLNSKFGVVGNGLKERILRKVLKENGIPYVLKLKLRVKQHVTSCYCGKINERLLNLNRIFVNLRCFQLNFESFGRHRSESSIRKRNKEVLMFDGLRNLEILSVKLGLVYEIRMVVGNLRKLKKLNLKIKHSCTKKCFVSLSNGLQNLEGLSLSKNFVINYKEIMTLMNLRCIRIPYRMFKNSNENIFGNLIALDDLEIYKCKNVVEEEIVVFPRRRRRNAIMENDIGRIRNRQRDLSDLRITVNRIDGFRINKSNLKRFYSEKGKFQFNFLDLSELEQMEILGESEISNRRLNFGELRRLKILRISNFQSFPRGISDLDKLEEVDCPYIKFPFIRNLPNLKMLKCGFNEYFSIRNCPKLEVFELSVAGNDSLQKLLQNNEVGSQINLIALIFYDTKFRESRTIRIDKGFENVRKLSISVRKYLVFRNSNFLLIPPLRITDLRILKKFSLKKKQLIVSSLKSIKELRVSHRQTISEISIYGNSTLEKLIILKGKTKDSSKKEENSKLIVLVKDNENLKILEIREVDCSIGDLKFCRTLEELSVEQASIDDLQPGFSGGRDYFQSLKRLYLRDVHSLDKYFSIKDLKKLEILECQRFNENLKDLSILKEITNLPNLRTLVLIPTLELNIFQSLPRLEELKFVKWMKSCYIGRSRKHLKIKIVDLPSLKFLMIENNGFDQLIFDIVYKNCGKFRVIERS